MTLPGVARDEATAEFFDGTAAGLYLIRRCTPHDHASKPQSDICSTCGSPDLRWEAASGKAKLVSWAVVPGRPADTDGPVAEPTIVAIGELDEGLWLWAQLLHVGPLDIRDGMRLSVAFERPAGSEAIPVLVPANL